MEGVVVLFFILTTTAANRKQANSPREIYSVSLRLRVKDLLCFWGPQETEKPATSSN